MNTFKKQIQPQQACFNVPVCLIAKKPSWRFEYRKSRLERGDWKGDDWHGKPEGLSRRVGGSVGCSLDLDKTTETESSPIIYIYMCSPKTFELSSLAWAPNSYHSCVFL